MEHQDFTTITIGKPKQKSLHGPKTIVPRNQQPDLHKIKIENESETFQIHKIPPKLCQEIIQARVAKQWKQKDMAHRLNVQVSYINEIESGKANYDPKSKEFIQKIQRLLGVKFNNK